jgi:hypothetical protein
MSSPSPATIYGGYGFFFRPLSAEKVQPPIQSGRGHVQVCHGYIYGGYGFFFRPLSAEKVQPPIQSGRGHVQVCHGYIKFTRGHSWTPSVWLQTSTEWCPRPRLNASMTIET